MFTQVTEDFGEKERGGKRESESRQREKARSKLRERDIGRGGGEDRLKMRRGFAVG